MQINARRLSACASCLAAAPLLVAGPGRAAAEETPPAAEADTAVAEVIVTATRRPEPLSKVPVAVSVIDGEALRQANLNSIRDLATIVPSLNFRNTASNKDQALFVRGLGTVSTSPGVEPTVSTVVDGVVLARQGQASYDLYDVDRIEVLRGPQGTLFGKNASGGVVNILTQAPTDRFQSYVDGFYGSEGDEWRLRGGVTGPLVEGKLRAGLNVLYADYQGNVTNDFDGKTVNGYNKLGARSRLQFEASPDLSFLLSLDYLRTKDTTPQGVVSRTFLTAYPTNAVTNFPAFAAALSPALAGADNRQIDSNYPSFAVDQSGGLTLEANWLVAGHTVTSITGYRRWSNLQHQDQDRLPAVTSSYAQQHDVGLLDYEQVSEELRVASPKGRFMEYVVGAYFLRGEDTENYQRQTTTLTGGIARTFLGVADYGVLNTNYSLFGEGTINFTPRLRAIAGARVVKDELSYNFARISSSPTPVTGIQTSFTAAGSTDPTGYADRFGLQYDLMRGATTYFTYSRGYKGPAYNVAFSMLPQDTGALKPETNNSYEIGLKSRLFGGALVANLAAFDEDFSNYQVNFFDSFNGSPITRLINAGAVSTRGAEIDLAARPLRRLSLNANLAYIDARIDRFNCPVGTTASCNVNGKPLPYSPKWKTSIAASYAIPLTSKLTLDLDTRVRWQSEVQFSINQTPDTIQGSYGVWDAGAAISMPNGLRVALLVKNITDQNYSTNLATFGQGVVRFVPRDDHRYVGLDIHKSF